MSIANDLASRVKYVPHSAAHFEVEGAIFAEGITADIRRLGWDSPHRSFMNTDVCVLHAILDCGTQLSSIQLPGRCDYVTPGSVIFLPAGSSATTRCVPMDVRALCLTIDAERLAAFTGIEFEEGDLCIDVRSRQIDYSLARIVDEIREPGFASGYLLESIATSVAIDLFRLLRDRDEAGARSPGKLVGWRMKRVKERIQDAIASDLSIADLAEDCGISVRHLIRTFKASEGITLTNYIARARVARAVALLRRTDLLVKQIAGECGFTSAAAFSAAFRHATGKSPREYRAEQLRFG